jgi:hypothetical protein
LSGALGPLLSGGCDARNVQAVLAFDRATSVLAATSAAAAVAGTGSAASGSSVVPSAGAGAAGASVFSGASVYQTALLASLSGVGSLLLHRYPIAYAAAAAELCVVLGHSVLGRRAPLGAALQGWRRAPGSSLCARPHSDDETAMFQAMGLDAAVGTAAALAGAGAPSAQAGVGAGAGVGVTAFAAGGARAGPGRRVPGIGGGAAAAATAAAAAAEQAQQHAASVASLRRLAAAARVDLLPTSLSSAAAADPAVAAVSGLASPYGALGFNELGLALGAGASSGTGSWSLRLYDRYNAIIVGLPDPDILRA